MADIDIVKTSLIKLESDLKGFAEEQREANKSLQEKVFGLDKTLGILAEGFKAINELQKEIKDLTNIVGNEVRKSTSADSELSERITVLETKKTIYETRLSEAEEDVKTVKEELIKEKHKDGETSKKF